MDSIGVCVLHTVRETDTFSYGGRREGERTKGKEREGEGIEEGRGNEEGEKRGRGN